MNAKEKELITKVMQARVPNMRCPMCGNTSFQFVEGYHLQRMQCQIFLDSKLKHIMPTITLVCQHCGFVSQHAIGAMNMIEPLLKEGTVDYYTDKRKSK